MGLVKGDYKEVAEKGNERKRKHDLAEVVPPRLWPRIKKEGYLDFEIIPSLKIAPRPNIHYFWHKK